jgi:hypothetical protein
MWCLFLAFSIFRRLKFEAKAVAVMLGANFIQRQAASTGYELPPKGCTLLREK